MAINKWELEEMTLDFLREHDPLFTARSKNLKMEYPYHSQRQTEIRLLKEITVSNLSSRQKRQCSNMPIEYDVQSNY